MQSRCRADAEQVQRCMYRGTEVHLQLLRVAEGQVERCRGAGCRGTEVRGGEGQVLRCSAGCRVPKCQRAVVQWC